MFIICNNFKEIGYLYRILYTFIVQNGSIKYQYKLNKT